MGKLPRGFVPPSAERRHPIDRFTPRREFCHAIQRQTPKVLADLLASVFMPVGQRLLKDRSHLHLRGAAADPDEQEFFLHQLRPALDEWEARWHLTGPAHRPIPNPIKFFLGWVEVVAVLPTLIEWASGKNLNPIAWAFIADRGALTELEHPEPVTISISIPGWALLRETREAFRARAEVRYKAELAGYIEAREATYQGWQSKNRDLPVHHFDFLALHQVTRQSRVKIGKEYRATRNTVAAGIKEAAEEVIGDGWEAWLMPNQSGGRPPRS